MIYHVFISNSSQYISFILIRLFPNRVPTSLTIPTTSPTIPTFETRLLILVIEWTRVCYDLSLDFRMRDVHSCLSVNKFYSSLVLSFLLDQVSSLTKPAFDTSFICSLSCIYASNSFVSSVYFLQSSVLIIHVNLFYIIFAAPTIFPDMC